MFQALDSTKIQFRKRKNKLRVIPWVKHRASKLGEGPITASSIMVGARWESPLSSCSKKRQLSWTVSGLGSSLSWQASKCSSRSKYCDHQTEEQKNWRCFSLLNICSSRFSMAVFGFMTLSMKLRVIFSISSQSIKSGLRSNSCSLISRLSYGLLIAAIWSFLEIFRCRNKSLQKWSTRPRGLLFVEIWRQPRRARALIWSCRG